MKTKRKELEKLIIEEVEAVIQEQAGDQQRIKPMLDGISTAYNAFLVALNKKIKENPKNMGYGMALRYLKPVVGAFEGAVEQIGYAEDKIGKSPEEIRRKREDIARQTADAIKASEEEGGNNEN